MKYRRIISIIFFFASQGTPSNNNSKIPESQFYVTNTKLLLVKFESKDNRNIIRSLDVSKVHGHNNISIIMLKICDSAIVEPLAIMFNSLLIKAYIVVSEKIQTYVLFIKNVTNKLSKLSTDQCYYYQFEGIYLKD